MNEIVERAARAMVERDFSRTHWLDYVDDVRAVIAALREPSEAMLEAAALKPAHWDLDGPDGPTMRAAIITDQWAYADKYRAMIDAALSND